MQPEPLSPVTVEVLALSEVSGRLHFRRVSRALTAGAHPDDVARHLCGLTVCTPGAILHSTSWRYVGASVVLTYAALPDPANAGSEAVPVDEYAVGGPLTPSPATISLGAVAAHACRHLALLAGTDAEVAAAAKAQPELWELLGKLAPAIPGGLG